MKKREYAIAIAASYASTLVGTGCASDAPLTERTTERDLIRDTPIENDSEPHVHDDHVDEGEEGTLLVPTTPVELPAGMSPEEFETVVVFDESGIGHRKVVYVSTETREATTKTSRAYAEWLKKTPNPREHIEQFRREWDLPSTEVKARAVRALLAHEGEIVLETEQLLADARGTDIDAVGVDSKEIQFLDEEVSALATFQMATASNVPSYCNAHLTDEDTLALYNGTNFTSLNICYIGIHIDGGDWVHWTIPNGIDSFINNAQEIYALNPSDDDHVERCAWWDTDPNCANCDPRDRLHIRCW